jgi:hypothetical protein
MAGLSAVLGQKFGGNSAAALAEQKRVRELLAQSRELETDASGLNGRRQSAWGSSAVFVPWRSGLA